MPNIAGKIASFLPTKGTEANNLQTRHTAYGDVFAVEGLSADKTQAFEGSRFVARPAVAVGGTGTAQGIVTDFTSDTANIAAILVNGESAGGKVYLPDYIRIRCTAAGSTTTSSEVSIEVDRVNRYASGGSTTTIYNTNPGPGTPASLGTFYKGVVTAAAAGANRQFVGSALIRQAAAPAWVINDTVEFNFSDARGSSGLANVAEGLATTVIRQSYKFAPCAVLPGGSLVVRIANVLNATTAPSWEWEVSWIER